MQQKTTSNLKQSAYDKKIKKASGLLLKGSNKAYSLIDELAALSNANLQTIIKIAKLIIKTGNYSKSIQYLSKAAERNSTSIDIYLLLASIYKTTGQLEQAVNTYSYILSLNENCAEANLEYGIILSMRGNHPHAIKLFNKCLANLGVHDNAINDNLKKNMYSSCYSNLGLSHTSIGQFDIAAEYYKNALSVDRTNVLTITGLANMHEKHGDKKQALDTILSLDKKYLSSTGPSLVYARLTGLHKDNEKAVLYLDNAANRTPDINEKYALYLQIGKVYEQIKQFDKSFHYYEKANNIIPDRYNKNDEEQYFLSLKNSFSKTGEFNSANASNKAVFILGMPRSGTSIVEQILSSHNNVHACGEQGYFHSLTKTIQRSMNMKYPECVPLLNDELVSKMSNDYFDHLSSISSKPRITDKLPHNFMHIGLIHLISPGSYIIHCKRSPIDICLSCYSNEFAGEHTYKYRLQTLAHYYKLYEDLVNFWKATLNIKWIDIEYEQLVDKPIEKIKELVNFLELEWDENCLQYYKSHRSVATASYDQATRPLYNTSVDKWKNFEKQLLPLRKMLGS